MRYFTCAMAAAACSLLNISTSVAGIEETVFENLSGDTSHQLAINLEVGDQVALGGTNRHLTKIELAVYSTNPITRDVLFRMYANDGTLGRPSTVLFDTLLDDFAHPGGGVHLISIDLGGFDAPDVLTWTLKNVSGDPELAIRAYNPPSVGSSNNEYWVRFSTGAWQRQGPVTYGGNFGARIFAVPGAGTCAALVPVAFTFAQRRRHRLT